MLPYLDHQATTPCDPAVVAAMAPWWSERFANPSNRLHRPALEAAAAVELARRRLAEAVGGEAEGVIFTSGATEAANLALKTMATGGVFIAGGIPPKILPFLRRPIFLESFLNKGRMRSLMESMPLNIVLNDEAALLGSARRASRILEDA